MWTWLGLGVLTLVAVMPLGCSTDEEDMHTQIVRLAQSKGGTATTPGTPKVQLPSGEKVWDLSGDWKAVIENYGPGARDGTGTNVYRITQTGRVFQAIRTKDDPLLTKEATERGHSPWGRAGSASLQGEIETTGFKHVQIVFGSGGRIVPSQGHITDDGKKVVIDNGSFARVTLTRP